jgi:hypothetical protein
MKYLFLLLVLTGCSSVTRDKCHTTDWYKKGLEDASRNGKEYFTEYKRECINAGATINVAESSYRKGIADGMKNWCNYTNGLSEGLAGRKSTPQCDQISTSFVKGYEQGYKEFVVSMRKKREEDERRKIYSAESEAFRRRGLTQDSKQCAVDSDCHKEGNCEFNRCEHNNQTCSYSYECKVKGHCREMKEYNSEQKLITYRVCDYD